MNTANQIMLVTDLAHLLHAKYGHDIATHLNETFDDVDCKNNSHKALFDVVKSLVPGELERLAEELHDLVVDELTKK